ncbi:MAG: hypothetical protein Q8L68_02550, partial [Methylococcales bacterium]|nr:hypothetical protein [Methylococcales bacterium]
MPELNPIPVDVIQQMKQEFHIAEASPEELAELDRLCHQLNSVMTYYNNNANIENASAVEKSYKILINTFSPKLIIASNTFQTVFQNALYNEIRQAM